HRVVQPLNQDSNERGSRPDPWIAHRESEGPHYFSGAPNRQDRRKTNAGGNPNLAEAGRGQRFQQYLPAHHPPKISEQDDHYGNRNQPPIGSLDGNFHLLPIQLSSKQPDN